MRASLPSEGVATVRIAWKLSICVLIHGHWA
jgi:hypothetical protein